MQFWYLLCCLPRCAVSPQSAVLARQRVAMPAASPRAGGSRGNRLQATATSGGGVEVRIRYILFLSLGIERNFSPTDRRDEHRRGPRKFSEPSGSRICRRNILALGCMLALAGLGGVDPHDLNVFGLKFSGGRGVYVLGLAVILAQFYWYVMRYHHLNEDGTIPGQSYVVGGIPSNAKLSVNVFLERKSADLWANFAAAFLTSLSWVFIVAWICSTDAQPSQ